MTLFLFSFFAGAVTIAGPCILPLLPIILGTSTVRQHKARPLFIILGFILSFSVFAVIFGVFGSLFGIKPDTFRTIAASVIGLFGLVMIFPSMQEWIFVKLQPVLQKLTPKTDLADAGLWSGFLLGTSLGIVWSPCAGPVLGSILTLIASKQDLGQAGLLLLAYSLGAGLPMLVIAYGGQAVATKVRAFAKYTGAIQRFFGVVIIFVAIGLYTGLDRDFQTAVATKYPWLFPSLELPVPNAQLPKSYPPQTVSDNPNIVPGTPSLLPVLAEHRPEFVGITKWWNTPNNAALTNEDLKGKVVLVDFWTYSCINCIRTYPFMRAMQEKYADKGLVIVGVHTPEFAFEAEPANVEREIKKNDLKFAVALDPDYKTWNAYSNRYWPAKYFFDRQGRLRATHFGEGSYEKNEQVLRELLAEKAGVTLDGMADVKAQDLSNIQTQETYFGLARGDAFEGDVGAEDKDTVYPGVGLALPLSDNKWLVAGTWKFRQEYVQANSSNANFRFNVQANMLHIVMESADGKDKHLEVYVDGVKVKDVTVNASTLYDIAPLDGKRHTVGIKIKESGVRFYAATFS